MTAHLEQDEYVGLKDRNDSNYISIKVCVNVNRIDSLGWSSWCTQTNKPRNHDNWGFSKLLR